MTGTGGKHGEIFSDRRETERGTEPCKKFICLSDLEQQEGRILRQGNQNDKVKIFRYVTENTFDSYMWVRHEVA